MPIFRRNLNIEYCILNIEYCVLNIEYFILNIEYCILKCTLKLVLKNILYYDAGRKNIKLKNIKENIKSKHQKYRCSVTDQSRAVLYFHEL